MLELCVCVSVCQPVKVCVCVCVSVCVMSNGLKWSVLAACNICPQKIINYIEAEKHLFGINGWIENEKI